MLKHLIEMHREHDLITLFFKAVIFCSLSYIVLMLLLALSIL